MAVRQSPLSRQKAFAAQHEEAAEFVHGVSEAMDPSGK